MDRIFAQTFFVFGLNQAESLPKKKLTLTAIHLPVEPQAWRNGHEFFRWFLDLQSEIPI